MPISQKNRSQRGTSGPGETPDLEASRGELTQDLSSDQNPESAVTALPDVPVVVASGEPTAQRYSATDAKLASRMTREIAQHLGLSGKSRSVRI
jgi:hypothetical protein